MFITIIIIIIIIISSSSSSVIIAIVCYHLHPGQGHVRRGVLWVAEGRSSALEYSILCYSRIYSILFYALCYSILCSAPSSLPCTPGRGTSVTKSLLVQRYLSDAASFVFYGITCLMRLIEFAASFVTFEENMC